MDNETNKSNIYKILREFRRWNWEWGEYDSYKDHDPRDAPKTSEELIEELAEKFEVKLIK